MLASKAEKKRLHSAAKNRLSQLPKRNSISVPPPDSSYKVLQVGERKINLAPISNKSLKQQQEFQKQKQQYVQQLKQENLINSKRLGYAMNQSKRTSKNGNTLSIDFVTPRNKGNGDDNLDVESIDEESQASPIERQNNARRTVVQQQSLKGVRRLSKRNHLFQAKANDSSNSNNTQNQQEVSFGNENFDEWIENDDFLKEIDQKERAQKKILRHDSIPLKEQEKEDQNIEKNYSTSSKMPLGLLKQKKNFVLNGHQININGEPLLPSQLDQYKKNKERDESVNKARSPMNNIKGRNEDANSKKAQERINLNQNKSIQNKRKVGTGNSSNRNNNNSSKTQTFTISDQLSEDSEMSINNEDNSKTKLNNDISPHTEINEIRVIQVNHKIEKPQINNLLFNDADFIQFFGEDNLRNRKNERKSTSVQDTRKKHMIVDQHEDQPYKRQESRNVHHKYQGQVQVDEKFDAKKEEIRLLLNSKNLKARVLYENPNDYSEDIQPLKKSKIKEQKRKEQSDKLKSLRFNINYHTNKNISKKKKSQQKADQNKLIPVRKSFRVETLQRTAMIESLESNLEQYFNVEMLQKKLSLHNNEINNINGSENPGDYASYQSPNYNVREDGVKAASSNDLSKNYVAGSEHAEQLSIQQGIPQQNVNGVEIQQEQRSMNEIGIPSAARSQQVIQRKKTDNNNNIQADVFNYEMNVQNEKKQEKGLSTGVISNVANLLIKMRSKKSSVGVNEMRRQDSLSQLEDLSISRQKQSYSSTKPVKVQQNVDKNTKNRQKADFKWDYNMALEKVFNDEPEPEQEKHKNQGSSNTKDEDDATHAGANIGKSIYSSSYYRRKDSKVSEGSESIGSRSALDLLQGGDQSSHSFPKDEEHNDAKENKQSQNKVNQIMNDVFEKEQIEQEYLKIRKKEIINLEKRGENKINIDWSGDQVLPISLLYKTQKSLNLMITTINHTKYDSEQNEGGAIGIIQAFRRRMKYFCHTSFFENSIMICVIINTVLLSLDGIVTDQSGLDTMSQFNFAFTIIFAIDMGLKLIGEGLTEYVSDKMNIFDAIIVCLSLFEMIFLTGGSGSSFSAFRAVRILRVFRVLRFMKLMITALGSAISQFIYILLLLFLFMFIYSLLGMSLFGGSFHMSDKPTRMNFDNFLNSSFAVLQLLTIENWNDLLSICIRSNVNNYLSILYLISWMFIGNYVFMNLVLAIIMDSFDSDQVQEEKKDIENRFEVVEDLDLNHLTGGTMTFGQSSLTHSQTMNSSLNKSTYSGFSNSKTKIQNDSSSVRSQTKMDTSKEIEDNNDDKEDGENNKDKEKKQEFEYFVGIHCQKSFYVFSQQNIFRKICYRVYKHPYFEQIILVAIILSSIKLTLDTYVSDQTSDFYIVGLGIDKFFTAFFVLEALIKMIVLGFFVDNESYLRDMWSQLDLFIVICSLIDVSVTTIDLSSIKILRLLRTLRPLRLLNHNKSMKLIVTALMESVGGITNMIVVVILIWLMFAILGLNLMKGKLNYCSFPDDNSLNYDKYSYHKDDCLKIPGATWSTYDINCDNIGSAMLFLFILSSFEGWPDYVFQFIDAGDSGPVLNQSAYFAFYFAVFIFVGGFFSINLFSAIMSFNFDIAQKKAKNKYLTDQQAQWIELQRMILQSNPDFNSMKKPQNKFRLMLWKFVRSYYLEVFIIFCILCNIITMAMAYDTSPVEYDNNLNYLNLFFTAVFISECIVKIIAFGISGYFFNTWNQFDFFVVCASIVDIVMSQMGKQLLSFLRAGPQLARVLRVLRVSRLLKLIKSFQNLQKLIQTTIYALPSLMNATALFLLFYFIFAILGCYLFSGVTSGVAIDSLNNFSNFHSSFLVLFRCSTGEDWMIIMFDTVKKTQMLSVLYFVLFIITQSYIMMNLFVLIIINQFEENYIDPDNPLQNFREQEESFKSLWVIMTEKENGIKIHERLLTDFYFELKQPLGYDYNQEKKVFIEQLKLHNKGIKDEEIQIKCDKFRVQKKQEAEKRIMQMNIYCDYEGYVFFNELFFFFFKFSLKEKINDFGVVKTQKQIEKQVKAIQILRKEENVTLKKMNYIKKKLMKQKVNKKRSQGVNPMVRRLFVGMCFKSWKLYSEKMQNRIKDLNFNQGDISSESDTDSDNDEKQKQSEFDKNEEEKGIKFDKKNIIERQHTIFTRVNGIQDKDPSNLFDKEKYFFLPNTEIYKDDYMQMGENDSYYSQRVFLNGPSHKDSLMHQDTKQSLYTHQDHKHFLSQPSNLSVETPIHFKNKENHVPHITGLVNPPSRFKQEVHHKNSIEYELDKKGTFEEQSQSLQEQQSLKKKQSQQDNLDQDEKLSDSIINDQLKLKKDEQKDQIQISLQQDTSIAGSQDFIQKQVLPTQQITINSNLNK